MSDTLLKVKALARAGEAVLSEHARTRLEEHDIRPIDVLDGLAGAEARKTIQTFIRVPAFWSCKRIDMARLSMPYGASGAERHRPL